MSDVDRGREAPSISRLGGGLIGLALVAVAIAYPPYGTGIEPLFGVGSVFLPLLLSVVALVAAVAGGILLARPIAENYTKGYQRLPLVVSISGSGVVLVDTYLVVAAGFAPQSPFVIAALLLAIAIGIVDGFVN